MADTVSFFLRRTRVSDNVNEYLYLTAEALRWGGQDRPIAPELPGNSASTVKGPGSTNFIVVLGSQKVILRVIGTIVPIASDEYPTLVTGGGTQNPSGAVYIYDTGVTGVKANQSAGAIRNTLLNYWADQALGSTYKDFVLGWPEWGATDDVMVNGISTRLYEGIVRTPDGAELAGEQNQFPFQFEFHVGDVL